METKNKSKLQFAAFCRVSTEKQEKTGESLRTQKNEIKEAVKQLGGTFFDWYGGQEHATPGHEKKEINRLLNDAQKKPRKFNAVMVTDADRWSRDNTKSRQGLDIFERCGIRFFIETSEQDLTNEDHRLFLGISAEIGQYFAQKQRRKSLTNKISRAKGGAPACGNLPHGRTYDKEKKWGIDKAKKLIIEDAARRYLAGETLPNIANEYNMDPSNLYRILTKRSGDVWEQTFNSDGLNIHATIKTKVPRLLSEKTIKLINKKSQANKTYTHGQIKHRYLLGRMIFCKHCGYAMFGQTDNKTGRYRYYSHTRDKRRRNKCKYHGPGIRTNDIEDIVMHYLFDCFGNPLAVQKAIEKATPNLKKIEESQKRIKHIETEIKNIAKGRDKILRLISKGAVTDKQAEKELQNLNERDSSLQSEYNRLCESLEKKPSPDAIKAMSKKTSKQFRSYQLKINTAKRTAGTKPYNEMTYEEKRALIEMVFSGKMPDGRRMGVYIEWDKKGNWKFDIHGHLIDEQDLIPMSDSMKKAYFGDSSGTGYKQKEFLTKLSSY